MTLGLATICIFGLISFFAIPALLDDAERMMMEDSNKRMRYKPKHFPEWYMKTPQWVIKYIWPADPIIPKVLYYEVIVCIVMVVLGPINIAICLVFSFRPVKVLAVCHLWLGAGMRITASIMFDLIWKEPY